MSTHSEEPKVPQKQVKWLLLHKGTPGTPDHELVVKLDGNQRSYEVSLPGDKSIHELAEKLVEEIHEHAQEWTDKDILTERLEHEGLMDFQKRKLVAPRPLFVFRTAAYQYQFDAETNTALYENSFSADEMKMFGQSFSKNWKPIVFKEEEVAVLEG